MASVTLSPVFNGWQGLGSSLVLLNGGLLNSYLAGTTTPAATYTTLAGNVQNTNPIVLNSDGRPPQEIWLDTTKAYKFVLTDSLSNVLDTYDNIYPVPTVAGVQSSTYTLLGTVAGTNTITATASPTLTAYSGGQVFTLTPANSNTGATTLNIDGLGAKNVFSGGAACAGGELVAAIPSQVEYDGTQFNILGTTKGLTFTPTVTLGGAAVGLTYTTQLGRYTKIGSRVFFNIEIVLSALGSSTGNVVINGLPFTATAHNFPCSMYANVVAAMTPLCGLVATGTATIVPYKFGTGTGNATGFTQADLGNSSQLFFNGHYDV